LASFIINKRGDTCICHLAETDFSSRLKRGQFFLLSTLFRNPALHIRTKLSIMANASLTEIPPSQTLTTEVTPAREVLKQKLNESSESDLVKRRKLGISEVGDENMPLANFHAESLIGITVDANGTEIEQIHESKPLEKLVITIRKDKLKIIDQNGVTQPAEGYQESIEEDIISNYILDEYGDYVLKPELSNNMSDSEMQVRAAKLAEINALRCEIIQELSDGEEDENDGYMSEASSYSDLFYVDPQLVWSQSHASSPEHEKPLEDDYIPEESIGGREGNKVLTKRYAKLKEDSWYPRLNSVRATVSAVLKRNKFSHTEAVAYTMKTLFHPNKPPKTQLNDEEMEIVRDRLVKWLDRKFGIATGDEDEV
jgi:hypothetical protein